MVLEVSTTIDVLIPVGRNFQVFAVGGGGGADSSTAGASGFIKKASIAGDQSHAMKLVTVGSNQTGRSWPTRNLFLKIINIICKCMIIFKMVKKLPKYHFF